MLHKRLYNVKNLILLKFYVKCPLVFICLWKYDVILNSAVMECVNKRDPLRIYSPGPICFGGVVVRLVDLHANGFTIASGPGNCDGVTIS